MLNFFIKPKPRKHCNQCKSKDFQDLLNELENPTKYAGVVTVRRYYESPSTKLPSDCHHLNFLVWEIAKHSNEDVLACIVFFLDAMPYARQSMFTNSITAENIQMMMQSIKGTDEYQAVQWRIQAEIFTRMSTRMPVLKAYLWSCSAAIAQVRSEEHKDAMIRHLLNPERKFVGKFVTSKDFTVAFLSLFTTTGSYYEGLKDFLDACLLEHAPKPKPKPEPVVRPGFRPGGLAAQRPMFPMPTSGPSTVATLPRFRPLPPPACHAPVSSSTTTSSNSSSSSSHPPAPPVIASDFLECDEFRITNDSVFVANPRNSKVSIHGVEYTLDSRFEKAGLVVTPDGIYSKGIDVRKSDSSSSSSSLSDLSGDEAGDDDEEFKKALQQSALAEQERKLAEREKEICELKKQLQARDFDKKEEVKEQEDDEDDDDSHGAAECRVCLDAPPAVVYVDCSHMCVCADCHLKGKFKLCPYCQTPILSKPIVPKIVT